MLSLEFLVTSFVVVLVPGTGVVYSVSTGLIQGRRASVFAALGGVAGIVPHLLATILGLAAVLHTSALAWQVLKYAGALYLFYIAWCTWRDRSALAVDAASVGVSGWSIVVKAVLLNVLNPKLTIFFLAFLPQFANPSLGPVAPQIFVFGAVFIVATFLVFGSIAIFSGVFGNLLLRSARGQRWLNRITAIVFVGLAVKLATSQR